MMLKELTIEDVKIQLDLTGQRFSLAAPELAVSEEPTLAATPLVHSEFLSAAVVVHKTKIFDDALYASVELAAQRGYGRFPSKAKMLSSWASAIARSGLNSEGAIAVYAAYQLGGGEPSGLTPSATAAVSRRMESFLSDRTSSFPIGFYRSSRDLECIFRQDRMLMTPLDKAAAIELARIIEADPRLSEPYRRICAFAAKLTNPPPSGIASFLDGTQADELRILVPSRSHEGDLVRKLLATRAAPDGFEIIEELLRRISEGTLDVSPRPDSGWYDYAIWAAGSLVSLEKNEESRALAIDESFRQHLRELFKAIFALSRETHVKQLDIGMEAACAPASNHSVFIRPELSVEPLATYYQRRALGYRFIRGVLTEFFGEAWRKLPIAMEGRAVGEMGTELDAIESLMTGAYIFVCRELAIEPPATFVETTDVERVVSAFVAWKDALAHDPDLKTDSRMMVPLSYDLKRRKIRVWALLGWAERPIEIGYATPPRLLNTNTAKPTASFFRRLFGRPKPNIGPQVEFTSSIHEVAYPVTAELFVDRVLDRSEFRRVCDQHQTSQAILTALNRLGDSG